ncbi:hypothetical protein C8R46DRAFT_1340945 [Mycena filopes]|nr:hypothetical protein C8R46DRAFT_1340945 [Mycena filopes]
MDSFGQSLNNAGIHIAPGLFIAIIAGGVIFIVALIVAVVFVHRRSKRQMMQGAFEKTSFSVTALTYPRPPLPTYQSSSSFPADREAQKQQDLVGREVRQQEQTYLQLMSDLQRPASRTDTPSLPDQAPRQPYHPAPRTVQWDPTPRSPLAYPIAPSFPPPPPIPTSAVADAKLLGAVGLKRGPSVRSLDSESEYSVASAPYDAQDRTYQPFTLGLAPIPASPSTPKWPSSPGGSYAWPKRQRASQMPAERAPETYANVRWKTGDDSVEPAASTPVAQAFPTVASSLSPGPPLLRINVPPPTQYRLSSASTTSVSTAQLFYTQASAASSSPTLPTPQPSPQPRF